jgi:hypothetical protein
MQWEGLALERLTLERGGRRLWVTPGVVGLLGLAAAFALGFGGADGRRDFFHAWLLNLTYFLSLALGALGFVLITHLTRAGWSVALRRVAEVVARSVVALAPFALVLIFGLRDLYEWARPEVVAQDALLEHKQVWLNPTFFVVRVAGYFIVWIALSSFFLRASVSQDRSGDPGLTLWMESAAAPAVIVYAVTVTLAAFDLLMSLYPHWYSTIFGVYYFAGCILGFLALALVLVAMIKRAGYLTRVLTTEHQHDLGKLTFGFVVFWAYIAFSQYMLIWYANLPEETVWYEVRQHGPWVRLSLGLLAGHFLLPFLGLMSRHTKRRGAVLVSAALWLLLMHWIDLFYLVMPEARPEGMPLRIVDLACFVGFGGVFLAAVFRRLGRVNLIPARDPRLGESLSLENA